MHSEDFFLLFLGHSEIILEISCFSFFSNEIVVGKFSFRKHINQDYDEHVLSVGEIDERIFLGEDANAEIGTPSKSQQIHDEVDESGR